jgi:sigma-B regulation protein RsbU (phosphoserine phosphatase)
MRYAYTPMRQIGGDYLYTRLHHAEPNNHDSPIDAAHLVVLDVTGHGVPAALTVNRIHGEIDRQLALNPILSPARLLAALNEYLHLTLAARSVYATALCLRIDLENDAVTWASAGHPPAFLRTVDNRLHHLRPTTIVLGAVPPDAFEHEEDTLSFTPGDTILAYTDGATETTDTNGRMVRVQGLEAIFHAINFPRNAPHTADATAEVARRLDDTRQGPNHDDTLLVQIARPLTTHKPNTPERPDEHPRTQPADAR